LVLRISIVVSFRKLLKLGGDAGWPEKAAEEQVHSSAAVPLLPDFEQCEGQAIAAAAG
jgi:hypothetical protein